MKQAFYIVIAINILRLFFIPFISDLNFNWQVLTLSATETVTLAQLINKNLSLLLGNSIYVLHAVFFIVSVVSQWAIFLLVQKVIRPSRKYISWIVICSTLFTTLFAITPLADGLVCLFWILALLAFYNAIFENDFKSWILSGIFMGLSTLSKLSGIALPIGLFVFLIFSSRFRYHLFKVGPYISLLIALVLSLPIWLGYLTTESASVTINMGHRLFDHFGIELNSFTSFIIVQILLIFPVLYIGLWWLTFKYLARIFNKPNQVNPEFWFLLSFFMPLFLGFHLIALFDWVDYLGLTPIYLTGFVVLLKLAKKRWFVWSIGFSILFHLLLIVGLISN